MEPPNGLAAQGWPLQTLKLEVMARINADDGLKTAPLCVSLLRLCALSLESLSWEPQIGGEEQYSFGADGLGPAPCFPRLRRLKLGRLNLPDSSILDAPVHDGVRVLDTGTEFTLIHREFFRNRGTML